MKNAPMLELDAPVKKGRGGARPGAGRKPGTFSELAALRAPLAALLPDAIALIGEAIKQGDVQAAGGVIGRLLPPLKPQSPPLKLNVPADADAATILRAALNDAIEGKLSSTQAAELATLVGELRTAEEVQQIRKRLDALDQQ